MMISERHRIYNLLSQNTTNSLIRILDKTVGSSLSKDVSNYAKDRTRCWLEWEPTLTNKPTYTSALSIPHLWNIIQTIWNKVGIPGLPNVGLVVHGEVGIRPHRDASYASDIAMTINLGRVTWGWSFDKGANHERHLTWYNLVGGEILVFDCKHLHSAKDVDPNRWAIVAWKIKEII